MLITYFLNFLKLFSHGYKLKLILLFIMSVVAGFLEFLGIALIFPLLILIVNPEQFSNLPYVSQIDCIKSSSQLIWGLLGGVVGAFILKNIFMVLNTYIQNSVLKNWQCNLNLMLFKKYLFSTYESKLTLSSKHSIFQVWQLSSLVFCNFVSRSLILISNFIILSVILVFLVFKFKIWAVLTGLFLLGFVALQNRFFKTKGQDFVREKLELMDMGNRSILSAIRNIKDIKIFGKEGYFYEVYKNYLKKYTKIDVLLDFYAAIPQNILEICIILSVLFMSYGVFVTAKGNSELIIASMGMLGAAIFRMSPLVNKIQMHLGYINANKPAIQEFFDAYKLYANMPKTPENTGEKLSFKDKLTVNNLVFKYGEKTVLNNINVTVKKGEFIGIIGASGVGKTTFADLLMGLLTSYSGEILVDNQQLKEKTAQKWLNAVGYVPQEITTLPVSIAENIAFGEREENIDYEKINDVVAMAQLEDYVNSLSDGVRTKLKDLQSLSQGQKQRIGIARALYKNPEILFLDEVTSALDVGTENKITEGLNSLKGQKTIIAIAHRLSTLKKCDRILYFKSDKEVLSGTFEELINTDKSFENLVKLSSIK